MHYYYNYYINLLKNQSYEHFIIEWDDNWPYPYINRIVRPGYDLQKPKLDENDKVNSCFLLMTINQFH